MNNIRTLLLCSLLSLTAGVAQAQPKITGKIKKAYLMPVPKLSEYDSTHGDVYLLMANNKRIRMTTSGMCEKPKIASDNRSYGWIEGREMDWSDGRGAETWRVFVPARILVFARNKPKRAFTPIAYGRVGGTESCDFDWRFYQGVRQIAVSSWASHGPNYYQLVNLSDGNTQDKVVIDTDQIPTWAKGLMSGL